MGNMITTTTVTLDDIDVVHIHLKGANTSPEDAHPHKGTLRLTFAAQNGIAFYVSKESVDDLTRRVQDILNKPIKAMLEDRIKTLHESVNDSVLADIIEKYGNTNPDSTLIRSNFVHISPSNDMGHAEKGQRVECGAELIPPYFP